MTYGYRLLLCAFMLLSMQGQSHAVEFSLASKAAEIEGACGARTISAYRNTNIAGTNVRSCHAFGQAVDMQGNASCIYSHLQSWPGGYSIDYARMGHVHISSCQREWGIRFNHGGGRRHHRHHRRHR